ncbi:MAG: thioredoxin family protein [Candidatus Syntropharchaeia archaeon]
MKIEIFGTGCPKCKKTEENAKMAVEELGVDAEIIKITGINEIIKRGVFMTPAVMIDGNLIRQGGIATKNEIIAVIQKLKK